MVCEKCWGDAYFEMLKTGKSQSSAYFELLEERKNDPCTPKQAAGQYWDRKNQRDAREIE